MQPSSWCWSIVSRTAQDDSLLPSAGVFSILQISFHNDNHKQDPDKNIIFLTINSSLQNKAWEIEIDLRIKKQNKINSSPSEC